MRVLAIDTAGWVASVALWEDEHEIAFGERDQDKGQAALLPELVKEVLGDSKVDQIIVNIGPGSFTGIRLGISFAKGLSLGWGVPLRGIDSFASTYACLKHQEDVLILIDARRQDVYGRRFIKGEPQEAMSLTKEQTLKILDDPTPPTLAGSGVQSIMERESLTLIFKGARSLAHTFFTNPKYLTDPLPFYVREADVSINKKTC